MANNKWILLSGRSHAILYYVLSFIAQWYNEKVFKYFLNYF